MTKVTKYNMFKGVSSVLTFGTPLITMLAIGESFLTTPKTSISGAAIFVLLISAFFLKDKILEHFKTPGALIIAAIAFIFCVVVESVIQPIKIISLTTMIACGVDEVSFKMLYKKAERELGDFAVNCKKLGFMVVRQKTIDNLKEENTKNG